MPTIPTPTFNVGGPLTATTGTFSGAVSMTALTATTGSFSGAVTLSSTLAVTGAITATGGQIVFPATQVPSADANTLDDYEEASVGITLTGVSGSVTGTAKITKVGDHITITIPDLDGTSNATTKTITGIPAAYFPASVKRYVMVASDNGGAYAAARAHLGIDGVVTLFRTVAGDAWTASGATSTLAFSMSYTLA